MGKRRMVLLAVLLALSLLLLSNLLHLRFAKPLFLHEACGLTSIQVTENSIRIEGNLNGASAVGCAGFDYAVENNNLYLKIYQQPLLTKEPLHGSIDIQIDGDFSKLENIYLRQPLGHAAVIIWQRDKSLTQAE